MALRLRWLKILRFRDVRPGTELRFNDAWNVVLGRNATGKTTLLNLISMALRGSFEELASETFAVEYELGDEGLTLRVSLRNDLIERKAIGVPMDPALRMERRDEPEHRVTLSGLLTANGGSTRFGTPPLPMEGNVRTIASESRWDLEPTFVMLRAGLLGPIGSMSPLLGLTRAHRFDEALELFRVVLGGISDASALPPGGATKAAHGEKDVYVLTSLDPREVRWSLVKANGDTTSMQGDFDACQNLGWAVKQLGGTALHAVYPVTKSVIKGDFTESTLGEPTITLRRPDGGAVSVRLLSFGQRRLFAFAWYLDSNAGPVVADELVNGMHYEWIDECVRAMEGRQKFITAQNPLILDHVDIASADDVARSFVLCRAETDADGRREVVWSNPSPEQSAEFFRAYENGVLKVHEILRTEGLW